jgi:hypothetical protein
LRGYRPVGFKLSVDRFRTILIATDGTEAGDSAITFAGNLAK